MVVSVPGVISIVVFNFLIVGVGIWAAWRTRKQKSATKSETIMVGGRDIGLFLGCFTTTATWVGGGLINGTAESVYTAQYGLLWTMAPVAYALSLMFVGLFVARPLRSKEFVTLVDPIQIKFGRYMGAILAIPSVIGELLYTASILSALGGTLAVIIGLSNSWSVIMATVMAVMYTLVGGLYSVAYTDVIQLFCIFFGLVIAVPFAMNNEAVESISETAHSGDGGWMGKWDTSLTGTYIDMTLVMMLGGVAYQSLLQRVVSTKSVRNAQIMCYIAAVASVALSVPPALLGAVAVSTNWTMTTYMNGSGVTPADLGDESMILPIVLQYLTPGVISFLGLGAVSAAVMSSVDSSLLSQATMFTRNVYKQVIRRNASENELAWVLRVTIVVASVFATCAALTMRSVYELLYLSADFDFLVQFPQLLSVLYFDPNTYGSLSGCIIGLILRLGGGEPLLDWPAVIPYPGGIFPFKTFAMLISFLFINVISHLVKLLFKNGYLHEKYDIFRCNLAHDGRSMDLSMKANCKHVNVTDEKSIVKM